MAHCLSKRHHPYDRDEIDHIRRAGGWVSSHGLVNDEAAASRSFGHFNLILECCNRITLYDQMFLISFLC